MKQSVQLVERDGVLTEVDGLLQALAEGRSCALVLEGGVGHGKTALLRAIYERAQSHEGLTVLYASCAADEMEVAYNAIRQLDYVKAPKSSTPVDGESGCTAKAMNERIAAGPPVLMLIDDLQWCDEPSLQVLAKLTRRMLQLPFMLVATLTGATPRVAGLMNNEGIRVRRLAPLTRDGVRVLCGSAFPESDAAFADACHEATAGVPLFLVRLLEELPLGPGPGAPSPTHARESAPPRLVEHILRHLRPRPPVVERALRRLSVFTGPVSLPQAADVIETDFGETADVIAEIAHLGIASSEGGILLEPPIVRRAVLKNLRPSERHEVAVRAAAVLASDEPSLAEAARLLLDTYPSGCPVNVDVLVRAALRARQAPGQGADAIALLRRALAEPPQTSEQRWTVLSALGSAELDAGQVTDAARHLAGAIEAAPPEQVRLRCVQQLALALIGSGRADEGGSLIEREVLSGAVPPVNELIVPVIEARWLAALENHDLGALEIAESMPRSATADRFRAALAGDPGPWPGPAPSLSESAEELKDEYLSTLMTGLLRLWSEDFQGAERVFAGHAAAAARRGDEIGQSFGASMLGLVAAQRGRLSEALDALADTERPATAGADWDFWHLGTFLALAIAVEGGDPEPAAKRLLALGLDQGLPQRWSHDLLLSARAQFRLECGEVQDALTDALEAGRRLLALGCVNPAVSTWRSTAALAHARLGDRERARELADEEVRLAEHWGTSRSRALALLRRGSVVGGAAGIADCEAALELADAQALPLVRARALLAKGWLQRRCGRTTQARETLREALALAQQDRAVLLEERICAELVEAGGRPRRDVSGRSRLTAAEEKVAALAARRWTNDQIARELYLVRRTVEAHLTSAYRKLGIRGRSELPDAMERYRREDR